MTTTTQAQTGKPAPVPYRWTALGTVYIAPPIAPSHKSFGLTVGGVLIGIAALLVWRGRVGRAEIVGGIGALLVLAALIRPSSLRHLAAGWGRVGHALGWFNSRVLLTVMFVFVLWPIGFIGRLFGSDPLERRKRASMWTAYPDRFRDPKHFERLF